MSRLTCSWGVQVPFRRVHLTEDAGHVDLYDTSGPQVRFTDLVHRPMCRYQWHCRLCSTPQASACMASLVPPEAGCTCICERQYSLFPTKQ